MMLKKSWCQFQIFGKYRSGLKLFSSNDQNQSEKYKKHPKKLKKENGLPKEKKETNSDYDKNDMIYVKY